jgi:ergothioneine biosynthesis protein EgtB
LTASEPSPSTPSPREARLALGEAYAACRAGTYALFDDLAEDGFRTQPHPEFSPPGWHLGHVAYTEAKWLLCHCAGEPLPYPELGVTFDVDGLPKPERGPRLPPKDEVVDYAQDIRDRVISQLDEAAFERFGRVWHFVLQHEAQHGETITFLRHLMGDRPAVREDGPPLPLEWIAIPAGPAAIGCEGLQAIDNEGPVHEVALGDFCIARHPVTQAQFAAFIEAGGYRERRWWDEAGWAWLAETGRSAPLYWQEGLANHPVMGVSAFEAEAFARFSGARLPSEAEWEKAAAWNPDEARAAAFPWGEALPGPETANCDRSHRGTTPVDRYPAGASAYGVEDMMGNVWEWTSSVFAGYDGFAPWPYEGYSKIYFDGAHRVLRGGSWATRPWAMRASFRNWYQPQIRQILAGFRLARDGRAEL